MTEDWRDDGIREKQAAARCMSCGHDVSERCDNCSEVERALRLELAATYRDHLAARGAIRSLLRAHRNCGPTSDGAHQGPEGA